MHSIWRFVGVVFLAITIAPAAVVADQPAKPRNPFGVAVDVEDPDGEDVQALAERVKLAGDVKDPNAEQWSKKATTGMKGSIEGEWHERWRHTGEGAWSYGKGPTKIKRAGGRVYFLVHSSNGRFLVDLKQRKNYLIGRYQGIDNPADTGPCVFLIVSDERIDGNWSGVGRWDFRRKLK